MLRISFQCCQIGTDKESLVGPIYHLFSICRDTEKQIMKCLKLARCNRKWIIIYGGLYICVMLSSLYFMAYMGSLTDDRGSNVVRAGVVEMRKNCPKTCNCTHFDMPMHRFDREPMLKCPDSPPNLVGRLDIKSDVTAGDVYNKTTIDKLKPGGFYWPSSCKAREKLAVIIPYRNRAHHLQILLYHLHTILQRQQLDYAIFVVEMALPTQFNRGILANIGFLTATSVDNFTCAIIHDVDLLPTNDKNLYRCHERFPRHLSTANSKYNYKLPYGHYIGGIVAFTREQFFKVNGFSNAYFGWGKEDDDLFKRIMAHRYKVDRPPEDVGIYEALPHTGDHTNPDNPMKDSLLLDMHERSKRDGLNSLIYTRLALEFRPLYTWVYVRVNETQIMQVQPYFRSDVDFLQLLVKEDVFEGSVQYRFCGLRHCKNTEEQRPV